MAEQRRNPRLGVRDPAIPDALPEVTARPVNTAVYSRQPTRQDSAWGRLEDALTGFMPIAGGILEDKAQERDEKLQTQAAQDAMTGLDPQSTAVPYVRYYQKAKGRAEGLRGFDQAVRAAYAESGLASTDDPKAFQEWANKFQTEYLQAHQDAPTDFKAGLLPVVQQSMSNLAQHHASVLQRNVMEGQRAAYGDELFAGVRNLFETGADADQIASYINRRNTDMLPLLGGSEVNDITLGILADVAADLSDPSLFGQIATKIKAGTGNLAGTRKGAAAIERVEEALYDKMLQRENQEWTRSRREKTLRAEAATKELTLSMLESGGEIPEDIIAKYAEQGLTGTAYAIRSAMKADAARLSPEDRVDAEREIRENPTWSTLESLVERGLVAGGDITRMANMIGAVDEGGAASDILKGQVYKNYRRGIEQALTLDGGLYETSLIPALELYDDEVTRYAMSEEARKDGPLEQTRKIREIRRQILEEFDIPVAGVSDADPLQGPAQDRWDALYAPPKVDWRTQPIPGAATVEEFDSALQALAEGRESPLQPYAADILASPEAMQEFVGTQRALIGGDTPEEPEEAATPMTNTVGGTVGDLLDFVASGESRGNYNLVWDGGAGEELPLTNMTIGEVLEMQDSRVASGMASSAAGRYQFIRSTLRGLVSKHKIPLDTKFSPATQDALAISLMAEAGLDGLLKGAITPELFAYRMAGTWAALPQDASGRGRYDGDGLNQASSNWGEYINRINRLRAAVTD